MKEERSKQGQTNNKAKQHSTPMYMYSSRCYHMAIVYMITEPTDLLEAAVQEIVVLVHKGSDGVGHVPGIVHQTKLVPFDGLTTLVVQLLMTARWCVWGGTVGAEDV